MIKRKNILPEDENGRHHGYSEWYYENEGLSHKGVYSHGGWYGYHETYSLDSSLDKHNTGYFLNSSKKSQDNPEGYCLIWYRNNRPCDYSKPYKKTILNRIIKKIKIVIIHIIDDLKHGLF